VANAKILRQSYTFRSDICSKNRRKEVNVNIEKNTILITSRDANKFILKQLSRPVDRTLAQSKH